ncbi:MAG TPA: hypothetical protein VK498_04670 [Ferruginibacter sp.]|nr:hypothetical protein [Ferruginibacter sp.]
MKKLLYFSIIQFIAASATAQLNTNLVLAATPPANLSEWGNRREVLTYIINSQAGVSFPVIIKTEIKTTDGTVIGTTDLVKARVITPSAATTILFANDVLPLEIFLFTGKYQSSLQRSGKLPSGNYMLCVQLVRPVDYTPVSAVVCKSFYLASIQLPVLMKPYNEEVLDAKAAQTAITFRWTPVVPRLADPVRYRLQVFEILKFQNPMQALRSNQPLLDKEVIGTTQYIWRPQLSFIDDYNTDTTKVPVYDKTGKPLNEVHRFIWTIQSLDLNGNPVVQTDGNGEGRSEPLVFFVGIKNLKEKKGE